MKGETSGRYPSNKPMRESVHLSREERKVKSMLEADRS